MIQHIDERLDRATEHAEKAAYAKGVARSFSDLSEHLSTFQPGCDPARTALRAALDLLEEQRQITLRHVAAYEARAEYLRQLVAS